MSANDETRAFLHYLLEHQRGCESEGCPACQSARKILELTRTLIFTAVPYPQIALNGERRGAQTANAVGGTRKASARKAA